MRNPPGEQPRRLHRLQAAQHSCTRIDHIARLGRRQVGAHDRIGWARMRAEQRKRIANAAVRQGLRSLGRDQQLIGAWRIRAQDVSAGRGSAQTFGRSGSQISAHAVHARPLFDARKAETITRFMAALASVAPTRRVGKRRDPQDSAQESP
jgi:hypothetical protein